MFEGLTRREVNDAYFEYLFRVHGGNAEAMARQADVAANTIRSRLRDRGDGFGLAVH
ncbi:MAG: hypothetical protein R3E97_03190 [Candidatus Eisenbacteria bacterium]